MNEKDERLAMQGPPGPQGKRGEKGTAGLSGSVRRSLVVLFAIAVLLAGLGLFWGARDQDANTASQAREQASQLAAQRHEQAEQQAEQQRAGVLLGEKLCITFGKLAALTPPAGNPLTNPSRAFDDELHATLDELGADLGCK